MEYDRQKSPSALIATFTFPPDLNGVAEASRACAQLLLKAGWKVDVATAPASIAREDSLWQDARVYEFDLNNSARDRGSYSSAVASYREFLKRGSWDVIIFQGYLWPLQLAVPLLPVIKARKVLVSHGNAALRWFPVTRFPFGLGQWARSVFGSLSMLCWAHRIDRWIFLSDQHDLDAYFDHTLARLANHPGIRIVPNGVGTLDPRGARGAFRASHGIPNNAFLFLCVAYYSRGKDQGFAVHAFRRANIPGSVLVFIGTEFNEWSREFQRLDAEIPKAQKRGRIIWLQKQTRDQTLAAYHECDAFILSSKLETQPISILEAMSLGKPWIARKAGCIPSLLGGLCVGSQRSMAEAMRNIASSDELRSRLSKEGRTATAETYSRAKTDEAYLSLLAELLDKKELPARL